MINRADSNIVDLSVIIVSWNVRDLLGNCLDSLLNIDSGLKIETIIVDNASDDGTVDLIESSFPSVTLIKNTENSGFAHACNQGYRVSKGEYVLFLNPDTVILDDCLEKTVSFLKSQDDIGVMGCRLLNADRSIQHSIRLFISNKNLVFEHIARVWPKSSAFRKRYDYLEFPHDISRAVDWLIGAFMLFPRNVYDNLGGFDEDYHMYHEDTDICYRVHRSGKKVFFYSDAAIVHYGNQSGIKRFGDWTVLRYYQSKHLFLKKHFSAPVLWIHRILLTGLLAGRFITSCITDPHQEHSSRKFLLRGIGIQLGIGSSRFIQDISPPKIS